jgi:starvation-inducible DNA-binding protein
MSKPTLDADTILKRATPLTGQHAHEIVLKEARAMERRAAEAGDEGTNDLIVSDVIHRNELQVWFTAEHVVNAPIIEAK